jgi:outer membrane protein assembly factor BamB
VSPASGPPKSTTLVSGSGFSAGADVDIYFDTADLALAVTDDTGSFTQIVLRVPASALPGQHTVSAVEPSTGANAQTPFLVNTNWSQFRMRASHDGHNLGENVLSPATVGGLSLLWKYTIPSSGSSPAVANGVVYVGAATYGSFYALKASTGALLWKFTKPQFMSSSPAVAHGVVYVGAATYRSFYALKASTGALLWYRDMNNSDVISSPAVVNGVVYVGANDHWVRALEGGGLLWRYETGSSVSSSPAVANGVVYVGSYDNNVYALNASTGALLWKYTTGSPAETSPTVANGMVYVNSSDGNVYAFGLKGQWRAGPAAAR